MDVLKKYAPQFLLFFAIFISCVIFLFVGVSKNNSEIEELLVSEEVQSDLAKEDLGSLEDGILGCTDTGIDFIIEPETTGSVVEPVFEDYGWFSLESCSSVMYATSSVNIRKMPSVDYEKVGMLYFGEGILVTGVCNNGWFRVAYDSSVAYISGSYLSESKPDSISAPSYEGLIIADGYVSDKWLYKLEANYFKVPENVRLNFQNNGWSIVCTSQHLGTKFYGDPDLSVQAVNSTSLRQIWVESREVAMSSIVHELGHYIDYTCNWASSTKEFKGIYREEVESFKSIVTTHDNNTNTESEYFAESYAVSVEYPDLMMQYCPKTYEYVMRYSNSL